MDKAKEIENGLGNFTGTEAYHRLSPLHDTLVCTDGVAWLAEKAGAYWLVDIIASYQKKCAKDPFLNEMQFWTLKIENKKGEIICEGDTDDIAFQQKIPYSDFPLPEIKLWVEQGVVNGKRAMVLLLPSEA